MTGTSRERGSLCQGRKEPGRATFSYTLDGNGWYITASVSLFSKRCSAYGRVETLPFFYACPLYVHFFADKYIFAYLGVKKTTATSTEAAARQ